MIINRQSKFDYPRRSSNSRSSHHYVLPSKSLSTPLVHPPHFNTTPTNSLPLPSSSIDQIFVSPSLQSTLQCCNRNRNVNKNPYGVKVVTRYPNLIYEINHFFNRQNEILVKYNTID